MKNKLVILCATQRCGSTMIVEDLRNTNVLGKAEEYFIPWTPEKDVDWLKSFDGIIKKSRSRNGVSSIKLMADQLPYIEKCLESTSIEATLDVKYPRLRTLLKDAVFIRIKRDGIVRQAVSRVVARKTGINHALSNNSADYVPGNILKSSLSNYSKKVTYTDKEIDNEVINIAKESLLWDETLSSWGIKSPLELHYEQVCKSYPNYIKRVSNYTAIEVELDKMPTKRNIKKLSNSKTEEIIEDYLY